jgi:hypothetical protein
VTAFGKNGTFQLWLQQMQFEKIHTTLPMEGSVFASTFAAFGWLLDLVHPFVQVTAFGCC